MWIYRNALRILWLWLPLLMHVKNVPVLTIPCILCQERARAGRGFKEEGPNPPGQVQEQSLELAGVNSVQSCPPCTQTPRAHLGHGVPLWLRVFDSSYQIPISCRPLRSGLQIKGLWGVAEAWRLFSWHSWRWKREANTHRCSYPTH